MKRELKNKGSALLMVVFVVALLSVLVMGMLEMTTEELQLMRNQIWAAHALATAEAGLNDAFSELRADSSWTTGFAGKAFNGGSYTVVVNGSTVTSTGTSSQGFVAEVEAVITTETSGPPYVIRVDEFKVNGE